MPCPPTLKLQIGAELSTWRKKSKIYAVGYRDSEPPLFAEPARMVNSPSFLVTHL